MQQITIVTGNAGKVREIETVASGRLDFRMQSIDLTEIQSLSLREIVEDKVRRAYAVVSTPVIVEDVSAGLTSMHGLPGPFIKFFHEAMGKDALLQLAKGPDDIATITCTAAYFDGKTLLFGEGSFTGKIVAPRGTGGFGFNSIVVPEGQTKTLAEMSDTDRLAINHRGKAFRNLFEQIEKL